MLNMKINSVRNKS